MSILRSIVYPRGSRLIVYSDGKKRYIPSPAYQAFRQQQLRKPEFKHTPKSCNCKEENCFKILAAIFGYSDGQLFKDDLTAEGPPVMFSPFKDRTIN